MTLTLEQKYTFNNFSVAEENELAYAVAQNIIKEPLKYNPAFIYGKTYSGKTHLLRALEYELKKRDDYKVLYETEEGFLENLLRAARMEKLKTDYWQYDALLLDDIYSLNGKPNTQQAFVEFLDAFWRSGRQIVMVSVLNPFKSDLTIVTNYMTAQCERGIIVDIQKPIAGP